jgi:MYXO-CTERM domain-containing protein
MSNARSVMTVGLAVSCLSLTSLSARALQQPDGTVIPVLGSATTCSGGNVQPCLDAEEMGMTINAQAAAAVTPETYDPSCKLTFKVLARGAGFNNTFGWYNVNPNGKPADTDLHSFLLCSDAVGTVKELNILSSPFYKKGKIGFFIATPENATTPGNCPTIVDGMGPVAGTLGYIYYSEKEYNPDNQGPNNSFIHLVTYNSVTHPKAFYFGWEDLLGGGDNDFDDVLTRVDGITCSGGGAPCDTGGKGICVNGTMQCQNGVLACVQQNEPVMESCNGLDDNCDGVVDEGDLCPTGKVCDKGTCVGKCGTGEFQCTGGLVCSDKGFCIDPACKDKQCPGGTVCRAGICVAPCDGVVCPLGQECRLDVCVDPCAGVKCDEGSVCDKGICKDSCSCSGCDAGSTCTPSGLCVVDACASQNCGMGTVCQNGTCVDACTNAKCPTGQTCMQGQCISGTSGAGGMSAGGSAGSAGNIIGVGQGGTGGMPGSPLGVGGSSAASGNSSSTGGTGANTGANNGTAAEESSSGCGCRMASSEPTSRWWLAGVALGMAAAVSRRRRSRPARDLG